MMRIAAALVLGVVSIAVAADQPSPSAPKPAPVPVQWEINVDVQLPKAISVQVPDEPKPRLFWYVVYTVSNHTDTDQVFVPEFVMVTDTGVSTRSGRGVPNEVFEAVKKSVNEPMLRDTTGVAGKLLQGDDNAKIGVAIWPDFDPKAGAFDIFIGGLSGETAEIKLPEPIEVEQRDAKGNVQKITKDKLIVSKTLQLKYKIPGEAASRASAAVSLVSKEWVMR